MRKRDYGLTIMKKVPHQNCFTRVIFIHTILFTNLDVICSYKCITQVNNINVTELLKSILFITIGPE